MICFPSSFLSKSQTWHIITARSVVDIIRFVEYISPKRVYHHAPACILCDLMIYNTSCGDDMQFLAKLMIYKAPP